MTEQPVQPKKKHVPIGLPIAAIIFLLLGIFVGPRITDSFSDDQLRRNALLSGISFLMIFVSILLFYMSAIWWLAIRLNDKISDRLYRIIEYALIAGIVLGVVMMFQPWVFILFRYGFYLLLLSTLGFIAWSHVSPAAPVDDVVALTAD